MCVYLSGPSGLENREQTQTGDTSDKTLKSSPLHKDCLWEQRGATEVALTGYQLKETFTLKDHSNLSGENRWRSKSGWGRPPASSEEASWPHCFHMTPRLHPALSPATSTIPWAGFMIFMVSFPMTPSLCLFVCTDVALFWGKKHLHLSILVTKIKSHFWIKCSVPVASTSST